MTPAAARAMYRRQMTNAGAEMVTVQRIVPNADPIEKRALGRVTGYRPNELVGGILQGDQNVVLLAEDLETAGFPLPLKSGDKVLFLDRVLNIQFRPTHRRVAGVPIAFDIVGRG